MNDESLPQLRLVPGAKGRWWSQDDCRLKVLDEPPKDCNWSVEVIEDDTFRVFSAPLEIPEVSEHPVRVMTGVLYAKPLSLGQFLWAKGKQPRQLYAIVYDSDLEHLTSIECLEQTWRKLWQLAKEESWPSLLVPLLGATHASFRREEIIDAFMGELPKSQAIDVYLIAPGSYHRELLTALSSN